MIYEGRWGGKGNTFAEESTWSPVINHIFFLSKYNVVNILEQSGFTKDQTIFQTLEQCGKTTTEEFWTFATSAEGTNSFISQNCQPL